MCCVVKWVGASAHIVWPPEEQEALLTQEANCVAQRLWLETKKGINAEHDALLLNKHENEVGATKIKLLK